MMTITYPVNDNLYINLTNRCPCSCTFCLRQNADNVHGSAPLWLDHEPSLTEIKASLDAVDFGKYHEVVFCGYGEPTERLEDLLQIARYIKGKHTIPIRLNTNGLSDLIWNKPTAPLLQGLIDTVSVSLNAQDAQSYLNVTRSKFGIGSFDAMLKFTKECTQSVPNVLMTVVDVVTSKEEQEHCKQICDTLGATLRVRPYEEP